MKLFVGFYLFALLFIGSYLYQEKTLSQSINDGSEIYQDFCVQCHLQNGQGVSGVFPPLRNSDYLMEDIDRNISAVKYGLRGPIEVNGEQYNGIMISQGLDDEEVADVMNYILNSWGNQSKTQITADRVQNITQ